MAKKATEKSAFRPLEAGEVVVLRDRRERRYRVKLKPGGEYHTHMGPLSHDDLIGHEEGGFVLTTKGNKFLVLRPTLTEAVQELPRHSQVIYSKDLGAILMHGDIFPGARVLEIGLGSGATSAAILRAIGQEGSLVTYEVREEVIEGAKRNIAELVTDPSNHTVQLRDAYEEGISEQGLDRIVMDVPEPWRLVEQAADALRPGGILLSYLPTVLQIHQLGIALQEERRFQLPETVELLERPWHVTKQSIRPEHRMIAHTGFITTARRCEPAPAWGKPVVETVEVVEAEADPLT
ncbi:MAG: tRNA (adenine-N1)-methyltransferase [Chloroflexi bacterium]|nr:tRNA (adenine-N1)-methyltransferase [Chloroflexota bacterium]